MKSAIYLPLEVSQVPHELTAILQEPPISTWIQVLRSSDAEAAITARTLMKQFPVQTHGFSADQVGDALAALMAPRMGKVEGVPSVESDEGFRAAEFAVLRTPQDRPELMIREPEGHYSDVIKGMIGRIRLVERLRETRAFAGFNRVFAENSLSAEDRKRMLRRRSLSEAEDWLPAYVVHGEGIYLELNEVRLADWERQPQVVDRVAPLARQWHDVQIRRHLGDRALSPRQILVHTFAHLLMNQLTFDCGYSTASLRERLYVSLNPKAPMAGLLIYTAAGDSDGTMGGLVRMGRPGRLESTVERALDGATWCSADPVCMEAADRGGQGPDACNLAACHNCALVPETACEEFNRFLDRGLVVGWPEAPALGFFSPASLR